MAARSKAAARRTIGLDRIYYSLPRRTRSLRQMAEAGQLISDQETLKEFGFRRAHVADTGSWDLMRTSAAALLCEGAIDPESIDQLFVASALPDSRARASRDPLRLFDYPATRLQAELGLRNAVVTATHQAGCVSLFSAIQLARTAMESDRRVRRSLCVGGDVLPSKSQREILYNLISDGACTILVDRDASVNRIVSYAQTTKGFFWTPRRRRYELIASYFSTARNVIERALDDAGLKSSDIALVLPHNVNRRSWQILLDLAGIAPQRLYDRNIARKGHTIAADPFINLRDAVEEGRVQRGDHLLLFSFGFGAHWSAMVLEH
jgi:3-oxoacyl-[acyl-carrier-protein] synthase III